MPFRTSSGICDRHPPPPDGARDRAASHLPGRRGPGGLPRSSGRIGGDTLSLVPRGRAIRVRFGSGPRGLPPSVVRRRGAGCAHGHPMAGSVTEVAVIANGSPKHNVPHYTYGAQAMPVLNSEPVDFREASESFATPRAPRCLQSGRQRHVPLLLHRRPSGVRTSHPERHGSRVDGGGRISGGHGAHAYCRTPARAESRDHSAEILLALTLRPQHKTKFFLSQKVLDRSDPMQPDYTVRSILSRFIYAMPHDSSAIVRNHRGSVQHWGRG